MFHFCHNKRYLTHKFNNSFVFLQIFEAKKPGLSRAFFVIPRREPIVIPDLIGELPTRNLILKTTYTQICEISFNLEKFRIKNALNL